MKNFLQELCEKDSDEIIKALPPHFLIEEDAPKLNQNVNVFVDPLRRRCLQFDTIHSVKGETHDATLILETEKGGSSNVKSIFPYFGVGKELKSSNYNRKCLYVAMSRPRKLLCLAIQEKTYNASKAVFDFWRVIDCRRKEE